MLAWSCRGISVCPSVKRVHCDEQNNLLPTFLYCILEMGRSSGDAEVRPKNVRLGSARQHETIRPKFGRTSANIRRHCGFELAAFSARR